MGHMNFLPGGGLGKRIFPEKIKVSPRGLLTAQTCAYHTPPRLYGVRSQKNFLTKNADAIESFQKFLKIFTFPCCAFRLGGVI